MNTIKLLFLSLILTLSGIGASQAQNGYDITVELENFEGDTLVLGYYLGNNQYVKDTAIAHKNKFTFKGDEPLDVGMYMVIVPPLNDAIQLVIEDDQKFEVFGRYDKGPKDIKFKGSEENNIYYSYVNFVMEKRPLADGIRKRMDSLDEKSDTYQQLVGELQQVDVDVATRTQEIIDANPDSYTALILHINDQIEIPEYEGDEEDVKLKRFQYYKKAYLKNINLDDPRSFRTPYMYERINYYVDNLTMRAPDSIIVSVDQILEPLMAYEDAFQYYLVHFLNKYAKSNIVGQDAVYVHIADKYYGTGKAPWTEEEQLSKILKNARALKPTLIGKKAPNLLLYDKDDKAVSLHDIEAEYLIIYFWSPDCGHCKKSTPKMIQFQKDFADKGLRVVAICSKLGKDYDSCWKYVDETEGMESLYVLGDEKHASGFKSLYYVKTTPKIYVLDAQKKIVSKGIGAEQLPELLKYLDEQDKNQ